MSAVTLPSPLPSTLPSPTPLAVIQGLELRGQQLMGVLNTGAAALVDVVVDALECEAWAGYGIRSPEHWAALRFGLSPARAGRLVAAARALPRLPACRAAFTAGELSEDHVATIVGAEVQPFHDTQVADLARYLTVGQLRHALSALPVPPGSSEHSSDGDSPDEPPAPPRRPRTFVRRAWREDGTWDLHAVLPPAVGALVDKALEAAIDKLLRARYGSDADPALRHKISALDALEHVAKVALDAMDPATAKHPDRTPSERYMVNIHLDAKSGAARLHLGPALPPAVRDHLAGDALFRTWITDLYGNVNLGRAKRSVDAKLRTVVEHRDGGCAVPGCHATHGLRIHHIKWWSKGGRSDSANLVALCPLHHRLVHRGDFRIVSADGGPVDADHGVVFVDRHGRDIAHRPPPPVHAPPATAAGDAGLPPPQWTNRSGERIHWDCLVWMPFPSDVNNN
jgi:hypothetical protein